MRPRDNRCHPRPDNIFFPFTTAFFVSVRSSRFFAKLSFSPALRLPPTHPWLRRFHPAASHGKEKRRCPVRERRVSLSRRGRRVAISGDREFRNAASRPLPPPPGRSRGVSRDARIFHGRSRNIRTLVRSLALTLLTYTPRYGFTVVRTLFFFFFFFLLSHNAPSV